MDFGANDELDYEEDVLERDSLENNSKTTKCLGTGLNTNTDFSRCGEEDYLEINCSEEDENFFSHEQPSKVVLQKAENVISNEQSSETFNSKIAVEETLEAQKVQKADEENEEAKEQKIYMGKGQCTQTDHSNDFNYNDRIASKRKIKMRKSAQPLRWRAATKKKSMRPLSLKPWLRECDSSEGSGRIKSSGVAPYKHRFLPSHPKCPTSRKPEFSFATSDAFRQAQVVQQGKLAVDIKKFPSSNSPTGTINGRNLTQQKFKPLLSQSLSPFDENFREFKSNNQTMNLSEKLACKNKKDCEVSWNNERLSNAGFIQKNANRDILKRNGEDFIPICRAGEPKEGCGLNTFKNSNVRNTRCAPLHKSAWECEENIGEGKKCYLTVDALKDDEKEFMKLKKEARMKRFMQDAIINKKEKESFEPYVATKSCNCLPNDLLKMEEPKLLEEKFQRREDQDCKSDHDFSLEKTNFKKELLLKKQNPFGGRVEMTRCTGGTKVKKEVFWNETFECAESSVLKEAKVEKELMENDETKVLGGLRSNGPGLFVVKNEAGSQVKFVRTISKSFNELGFGKSKTEGKFISERNDDTAFVLKALPFSNESMQGQVTSQLTGRVVKVLNIPPSATTNDILSLCGDIGIVREVKLNFPKENSAVIRFAEPSSAENFFSLYHGQKMNNYFLNVIII